jgi:hypothetical protein
MFLISQLERSVAEIDTIATHLRFKPLGGLHATEKVLYVRLAQAER